MLFHTSSKSGLTQLNPHIPFVWYNPKEDGTTPRICFAPTIGKYLRSIGSGLHDAQTFQMTDYTSSEPGRIPVLLEHSEQFRTEIVSKLSDSGELADIIAIWIERAKDGVVVETI